MSIDSRAPWREEIDLKAPALTAIHSTVRVFLTPAVILGIIKNIIFTQSRNYSGKRTHTSNNITENFTQYLFFQIITQPKTH